MPQSSIHPSRPMGDRAAASTSRRQASASAAWPCRLLGWFAQHGALNTQREFVGNDPTKSLVTICIYIICNVIIPATPSNPSIPCVFNAPVSLGLTFRIRNPLPTKKNLPPQEVRLYVCRWLTTTNSCEWGVFNPDCWESCP